MNEHRPDFEELVGEDLDAREHDRLRRVHDALVAAGPPPDLSPELRAAPEPRARIVHIAPRRRRVALVAIAAALGIVVFGAGFFAGDRNAGTSAARVVPMTGTSLADGASASLSVFGVDAAGNWPMRLSVEGLRPSAAGRPYELWLTRHGKPIALCGSFLAKSGGTTIVPMNAPYRLQEYDGWVVVQRGSKAPLLTTT